MLRTTFTVAEIDCPSEERLIRMKLEGMANILGIVSETLGTTLDDVRPGIHRNMAISRAESFTGFTNPETGKYFGGLSYPANSVLYMSPVPFVVYIKQ